MRCSYCIVPKTRGNELSRPMEDVLAEAKFLARAGVKEITLLGQIVNNYGERKMPMRGGNGENEKRGENGGKTPFVQLLHGLNDIGGIERIRYMSPHPRFFCNDLIAAHGSLPKLCPSVHLPIQSGSNRILKAMRRAYLGEMILEIVGKLRDSVAKIGISTDIIVGYPGETEEEFEKTVSLFCDAKFNMAFVFKYSPREGTQSATLADSVSKEDKERRNQILLQHVERASEQYNGQFVGTTVNVLVEGHAKRGENMMFGWTPEHCKVLFPAENNHIGKILPVKIDSATAAALAGSLTANRSTNN